MALSNDNVLTNVFEFVGSGHFFFVANVNTRFHEAYKHYLRTRTIHAATGSQFVTTADSIAESEARFESAADEWTTSRLRQEIQVAFLVAVFSSSFQSNKRMLESTICFWPRISAEQVFSNFLQYVTERFWERNYELICHAAAKGGHLPVLECAWETAWFSRLNARYICRLAARHGHLHIIQWAEDRGCDGDGFVICSEAARYGHLDIAKWGHQNRHWSEYHCEEAAKGGQLHILEWAHANDSLPLSERICARAAQGGQLGIIQWARENGCDWDEHTYGKAVEYGHLHVVQWVLQNGCPWDPDVFWKAPERGQLHILLWARENGWLDENEC